MSKKSGKIKIKVEPKQAQPTEGVYRVERILRKRSVRGKVEYYVKWEGYTDDDNTWEPAKNILCRQLIRDFEESQHPGGKTHSERKKAVRRPVIKNESEPTSSE